jgi:hypothetical protein
MDTSLSIGHGYLFIHRTWIPLYPHNSGPIKGLLMKLKLGQKQCVKISDIWSRETNV